MNYKSYALDQAIESFRIFLGSSKPLGSRNVLSEAGDVFELFSKVVDACQDPSIEDTLRDDRDSLSAVLRRASADSEDSLVYGNARAAAAISTAFANVVLHLATLKNALAVQDPEVDLARHGSAAIGREGYGDADKFMTASAFEPGESSGKDVYKRSKGREAESNAKDMMAATQAWLSDCPELTRALHGLFQGIGLEQTANPEGALNPFTNISDRAKSKSSMSDRQIYSGVATTQLYAALLFAISTDESNPGDGYPAVSRMLAGLLNGGSQDAMHIPSYVFKGADAYGKAEILEVRFSKDGYAVPASKGPMPTFSDIREIYSAADIDSYGAGAGDPVRDLVTAIRSDVIAKRIDPKVKSVVNTALNLSDNFDEGGHEDVIERFSRLMMDGASRIKGDPDGFIPLSVLYLCTDSNVLNAANAIELERAYRNRVDAQDRAIAGRIMRETFDPSELHDNTDLATNIERHRSDIEEKTAEIVAVLSSGENPGEGFPYAIVDSPCAAGKTLADIMGEDLALNYVNQVIDSYRATGKADTTLQTPGDALRTVAGALAEYGNGNGSRDDAVSAIVAVFGPRSEGMAGKLVDRFDDNVAKAGFESDIPLGTLKHIAARTVLAEFQKSGDFTNMLGEKYRTRGLADIRATRLSRGNAPTPYVSKVDGESGADVMFRKTEAALLAVSAPDGDPEGKADEFLTQDIRYKERPDKFNEVFDDLWNALVTLGNSSAEGMAAALAVRNAPQDPTPAQKRRIDSSRVKLNSLKCSTGVLDKEHAGKSRQWAIDILDNAIGDIVYGITRTEKSRDRKTYIERGELDTAKCPETMTPLMAEINRIAHERYEWRADDSEEKLAAGISANRDDSVLEADHEKIRRLLAHAYAYSPSTYPKDAISIVNGASKFVGVGEKDSVSRSEAEEILSSMADIPESPVKRIDSDTYGDEYRYRINGTPVTDDEAFIIINSAMNMYEKRINERAVEPRNPELRGGEKTRPVQATPGAVDRAAMFGMDKAERLKAALAGYPGKGSPADGKAAGMDIDDDAFVNDFSECLRRCSSLKKDYPFSGHNITVLTMRTLKRMGLLKDGAVQGTVEFKYRVVRNNENAGERINRWFVFDVPVSLVTGVIESQLSDTSNSANDWTACAAEIDRLRNRNRDVKAHNATLSPGVKNQLGILVNDVRTALARKCGDRIGRLDAGTLAELLRSQEPMDIGGFYARPSRTVDEEDDSKSITAGKRRAYTVPAPGADGTEPDTPERPGEWQVRDTDVVRDAGEHPWWEPENGEEPENEE
jgi:hypothetical protein